MSAKGQKRTWTVLGTGQHPRASWPLPISQTPSGEPLSKRPAQTPTAHVHFPCADALCGVRFHVMLVGSDYSLGFFLFLICSITEVRLKLAGACIGGNASSVLNQSNHNRWPIGSRLKSYVKAVIGPPSAPPILCEDFWFRPTACSNGSRLMFCTAVQ